MGFVDDLNEKKQAYLTACYYAAYNNKGARSQRDQELAQNMYKDAKQKGLGLFLKEFMVAVSDGINDRQGNNPPDTEKYGTPKPPNLLELD